MKSRFFSAFAVVALSIAGTLTVVPTAGAVGGAGTVSGTVSRPSGAAIQPGTSVLFCPQPIPSGSGTLCASFAGGFTVPVASDGTYSSSVPEGTWYAMALVGSFESAATGPLTVVDGGSITQNFSVSYATVIGTVRDAGNTPLSGLTVQFCQGSFNGCAYKSTGTDGAGTYSITLAAGTWIGRVQAPGGAIDQSAPVALVDGDSAVVDFHLGGGTITGSVKDAAGVASPSTVALQLCTGGACKTAVVSGPTFVVAGVTPGTYDLYGATTGGGFWVTVPLAPVVVTDGATTSGVVLRLGAGSIDATVTDGATPLQGATIQPCLQGVTRAPSGELCTGTVASTTNASGHAVAPGLPDGTYTLKVSKVGFATTNVTGVVVSGGSAPHVDVVLGAPALVSGTVSGNLGTTAAVAACAAPTDPDPAWTGSTNPCGASLGIFGFANTTTGAYSLSGLAPGTYRFRPYAVIGGIVAGPVTTATLVSGANTVNLSMSAAPLDDGDGVNEDPAVDGNGDGTPDAQQANVTTLPSGGGAGNVTIASPGSTTLQAVTATGVPASPVPPSGAQFPAGLLGFKVAGVSGGSVDVDVHLPAGSNPTGYLKLRGGAWADFSSHVTINGDVVTLHLVDNDAFDTDPAVGVIGDPGAPVVGYKFTGFRSPIDALPAVNSAKGGQAIPVKWRITTAAGAPVSDASSFVSLTSTGGACGAGATDEIEAYAPGASGLQYLGNGEWQVNWKTEKAWAGQCRTLTLKLADGLGGRTASFKFK